MTLSSSYSPPKVNKKISSNDNDKVSLIKDNTFPVRLIASISPATIKV